ncbi:PAS domain-containing protein [Rhodobacterales bacterium HKCCE2091]|nr:PAS domain-containing protein [Rhodobacterales bacterium HKCCE2091]
MPGRQQDLVDPSDPPERQVEKLRDICEALMNRVEQVGDPGRAAYDHFQRAVMLEDQVQERTRDLERALDLLNISNASLAQANAETERARSDLANAIETILDGFALFDRDEELVLYNSRFCEHLSDVRASLRPGLAFIDYVDAISRSPDLVLPAGVTREDWAVERMERHAEAHVMFNVALAGNRWIQVSEHRTEDGQTVILQTDVSDILNAEREEHGRRLDDQAAVTRATLEHMAQGVGVFDARNRLVYFNQRLATMMSIPLTRLRAGLDADTIMGWIRRSSSEIEGSTFAEVFDWLHSGEDRRLLRFTFRQGAEQWFDVLARQMQQGGMVVSITDVSTERLSAAQLTDANQMLERRVEARTLELKDALQRAERANTARTRFVAAASHDLLQPLSAAKLYLSSVSHDLESDLHRQVVEKAQGALISVQELIEALLDISRLESDSFEANFQSVDLAEVLDKLQTEFAPAAAAKGIGLRLRSLPVRVRSDPAYLRRILQNLIANAVRYTNRGRVLVGVQRRGGRIRVNVWDTGIGIPEAEQANVFKEFQRLGKRASASEGLGLGLAIVERACATLGHELSLTSAEGRGTVIGVTLDEATPKPRSSAPKAPAAVSAGWRHDGHVALIIENDLDFRNALTVLLEGWGVTVLATASADEAIRACRAAPAKPTIALIDYQLDNDETAIDAVQKLEDAGLDMDIRVMTADRSDAAAMQLGRFGSRLMYKPLDPLSLHLHLTSTRPGA